MFIVNIEDFNAETFFICDKELADKIIVHNFPLMGIYDNKYYFQKTTALKEFLSKGGEQD